jgi:chemosensory pili system protein ChpA (sensor histidine kinase/response regulator)
MLRVRADMIDRLVNEAGEVAITRARIESELRALKANLLELTGSVVRLRNAGARVRDSGRIADPVEAHAGRRSNEGFDPLEFDRYTRFQELARSLAEGVNDVSTIQQSLLRNLDVTDAALISQARSSRDVAQTALLDPHGSVRQPERAAVPDTARHGEGARQAREPRDRRRADRARSLGAGKLVGPLEHLLRNCARPRHRAARVRTKAGKSETGEIALTRARSATRSRSS